MGEDTRMIEWMSQKQLWLLNYENPLSKRFGTTFFRSIPKCPGVYSMFNCHGSLLYVGKAKNLKNRIRSYLQAKPDRSSRKTLRLVHSIAQIKWEICDSEQSALLRENQLLRTLQPPFNALNVYPEMYYFLAFESRISEFCFRLTQESHFTEKEKVFGAFKSRRLVFRGYSALLRLLWANLSDCRSENFEFPGCLMRRKIPLTFRICLKESIDEEKKSLWTTLLSKFLNGDSQELLFEMTQQLLNETRIHPFYYRMIQDDLNDLNRFFHFALLKSHELRQFHQISSSFISQDQIDDLLVIFKKKEEISKKEG